MRASLDHRWEGDRAADRPVRRNGRVLGALRQACTPGNLALCAVVAFGWFALIGWTGAGPKGWQARLCADLALQPRACAILPAAEADRASLAPMGSAS
ncbi:hypothetical protein [Methylobacterium sp. Leaf118]|uniref:hypothetical protein n=1 Tax=Methylobacterium sp. Leaf118 TaxID=2876562 RepID=UPI001E39313F|nr:hypothetical protein [Methylobacterium sp. Leaf118]